MGFVDSTRGEPPWIPWKPLTSSPTPAALKSISWLKAGTWSTSSPRLPDCSTDMMQVRRSQFHRTAGRQRLSNWAAVILPVSACNDAGGADPAILQEGSPKQRHALTHRPLDESGPRRIPAGLRHEGAEPAVDFFTDAPKPLAILASTDAVARQVCDACFAIGFTVPDDVAVLGLGNTILAESTIPSLSSIDPPGEEVGFQATAVLHRLLQGEPPPPRADSDPGDQDRRAAIDCRRAAPGPTVVRALAGGARDAVQVKACAWPTRRGCSPVSRSHLEQGVRPRPGTHAGRGDPLAQRLQHAEELLQQSDHSITEIAGMLGFDRTGNFSEFFRKHIGMSPRAYQRSSRTKRTARATREYPCSSSFGEFDLAHPHHVGPRRGPP